MAAGTGKTIGEKIQQLRKERGLSQEQLAGELKVSRQAVSKWELNASVPEVEKLVAISRLFEVSADELLTGVKQEQKPEDNPEKAGAKRRRGALLVLPFFFIVLAAALFWYARHSSGPGPFVFWSLATLALFINIGLLAGVFYLCLLAVKALWTYIKSKG